LYDLQGQLAAFNLFTEETLHAFATIFFDKNHPQEDLQPILNQVVADWRARPEQEREEFRSILQKYIRAYGFLSQILTFRDADLEKLYVFARHLNRKLDRRRDRLPYEVLDAVDLDSFRIQETFTAALYLSKPDPEIYTAGDGGMPHPTHETDFLSHILELLNDTYGINLSDEDKVDLERIKIKLESNDELHTVFTGNNTLEAIRYKFNQALDALILEFVFHKLELYKKLTEPDTNAMFKQKWFEELYRKYHNPTERTAE